MSNGLLALVIGVVAGMRSMMAPAAACWAAHLGFVHLQGTPVAFLAHPWTVWIFTALALAELVGDQLPTTPSRTVPAQFGFRIISGAASGLAFAATAPVLGVAAGVAGAIVGTLGGRAARGRLATAFRSDRPAAFIEDAIAIGVATCVVVASR